MKFFFRPYTPRAKSRLSRFFLARGGRDEVFFFALIPHGQSRDLVDFFWQGEVGMKFFFSPLYPTGKVET